MLLSTTVFHCLLAALLPHLSPTLATDDGWHLDFIYTLVTEELDPVVSPNAEGSHMHKVIGGSRFGASYNYAEYSAANCSSLRLQADKSNYWMPALYVRNSAGMFVGASASIRFYYFNARSSPLEPVTPFPKGLRMIAGNPNNKVAANTPAAFTCQVQSDFENTLQLDSFNFERDCPWGMKTALYFPNCWDGLNLYLADGSHMAYVIGDMRDGNCPISHPVRIPTIQLEYTWDTSAAFGDDTPLAGNVFWANGDSTGYGIHGDFVNGWDLEVLSTALKDPDCGLGLGQAIPMQDCPYLYSFFDDAAASACRPEKGVLAEPGNVDLTPLDRLPGCNSPWGNGTKPACTPDPLNVTALMGVDGAYVADPADRMNFVVPTAPGWQEILCVKDISTVTGGSSFTDGKMTQERCQDSCMNSGFNYAATGLIGNTWNCVCGSGLDMGAALYPLMCTNPCPGNSSQACGGDSYIFNVYYAPPGTVPREAPDVNGTIPLGCYDSPGWSSGLLAALTYTLNSPMLTTESCIAACRGANTSWALTYSGTYCGCGNEWNVLPGIMVPADQCTEPCGGNVSDVCGNFFMASVYDISMTSLPGSSAAPSALPSSANASISQPTGSVSNSTALIATNSTTYVTTPIYTNVTTPIAMNVTSPTANATASTTATTNSTSTVTSTGSGSGSSSSSSAYASIGSISAALIPIIGSVSDALNPLISSTWLGYLGCYTSPMTSYFDNDRMTSSAMTPLACRTWCNSKSYTYLALSTGTTCTCANSILAAQSVSSSACDASCAGDSSVKCGSTGAFNAFSVYKTNFSSRRSRSGTAIDGRRQ